MLPLSVRLPFGYTGCMTRRYKVVDDTSCYFITCSTVWWTPVFISSETCEVIIESLFYCRKQKGLHVFAYVIMPTHFHGIVSAGQADELPGVMRDLKRHTSRELVRVLERTGWELPLRAFKKAAQLAGRGSQHKVWQDEFHPVAIVTEKVFRRKLDYIHGNPVRKGLVMEPSDWCYSSARSCERDEPGPLELDAIEW